MPSWSPSLPCWLQAWGMAPRPSGATREVIVCLSQCVTLLPVSCRPSEHQRQRCSMAHSKVNCESVVSTLGKGNVTLLVLLLLLKCWINTNIYCVYGQQASSVSKKYKRIQKRKGEYRKKTVQSESEPLISLNMNYHNNNYFVFRAIHSYHVRQLPSIMLFMLGRTSSIGEEMLLARQLHLIKWKK